AAELVRRHYGIEGSARPLPSERDLNFLITGADGFRYVFKIANQAEDPAFLEAQNRALNHLAVSTELTPRVVAALSGEEIISVTDTGGDPLMARLVSWRPGIPMVSQQRQTAPLMTSLGRAVGTLDRGFAGFDHPALHRDFHWDLNGGQEVAARYRPLVSDPETGALVDQALAVYESETLPLLPGLRKSVIHNDGHDHNVIVGGSGDLHTRNQRVTGSIDFGDMVYSHTAGNLAVAVAYAMLDKPDPLATACRVVEGYHAEFPLEEDELAALFGLACLRLALSASIAAHQMKEQPDDPYLGIS
ncbi:MAG: phosphotransferase, partial [Actinomycetia bacterium]|nr:phosphotransferase [Actinomycetes bacterium]